MFVTVRYYKPLIGAYAGNDYTYETQMALVRGDKVIAPTAKEPRNRAIVTAVNVEAPEFACKEITEYDDKAEEVTVSAL